jgi:hypothetical protein
MTDESKKGPVKPPIIDAKAAPKSTDNSSPKSSDTSKPNVGSPPKAETKKPAPEASKNASAAKPSEKPASTTKKGSTNLVLPFVGATLLGGVLGAGSIYVMAQQHIGPFEKTVSSRDYNATIETLQKRIYDLENAPRVDLSPYAQTEDLTALQEQIDSVANAQIEVDFTPINQRIDALENSIANLPNSSADADQLNALQSELGGLKSTLLDISPENIASLEGQLNNNEKLASLDQNIASLQKLIADLKDTSAARETQIASLESSIAEIKNQINQSEASATNQSAIANLPLVLSAWQSALDEGRPFADYLSVAQAALPELNVGDEVQAIAASGAPTSSELSNNFQSLLPSLSQAQSGLETDAPWYDQLLTQAKSAVGLRPLNATGDDPMAIIARIESALANDQAQLATTEFAKLPDQYANIASEFGVKLEQRAAAQSALAAAQAQSIALASTEGK